MLKGGLHYPSLLCIIQTINDIKVFKLIFINFNKNLLFIIILSLLVAKF